MLYLAAEGYPRADVDVMAVRHLRQQIIMKKNDLKSKLDALSSSLEQLHSLGPDAIVPAIRPAAAASAAGQPTPDYAHLRPFALVDDVSPGSPASEAGLLVNDRIVAFGDVRGADSRATPSIQPNLGDIAGVVRSQEGQAVTVVVRRGGGNINDYKASTGPQQGGERDFRLSLTPKTWAGAGLLGCHVLPL